MWWLAIGRVGRWLYELADHRLEFGDPAFLRHATLRLRPMTPDQLRALKEGKN